MKSFDASDLAALQAEFRALEEAPLSVENAQEWLQQWSDLSAQLWEQMGNASSRAHENTADPEADARHVHFLREIMPAARVADERLKQRLMALDDYEAPTEQEIMMRDLETEQRLFRDENVPIQTEASVLGSQYRKQVGNITVEWQGEQLTLDQAELRLQNRDRAAREAVWRAVHERWQQERDSLNELYLTLLPLRQQIARNAGFANYRDYAWLDRGRHDYTPDDAFAFHAAIEAEAVPLASEIYERRRAALGVETLRPWDLDVETEERPPLAPFATVDELVEGSARIFHAVDPELGAQFDALREGGYLELEARPNKAPGAYCRSMPVSRQSYIFMSAVGKQRNVQTLLHEAGHAFHNQNSYHLPLAWMRHPALEFCEVASMGMELLASPYLEREAGGFYDAEEANRARKEHLEKIVTFLPYMAVVDAFQHWVYTEAPESPTADDLDAKWLELWRRYMRGIDYTGLEEVEESGWHRKLHIFGVPFYYIEYGLAQVGALQLWRNARENQAEALAAYRRALALGNTRPLPELFEAAGIRLAFDGETLRELMTLVREELERLDA